MKKQWQAKTAYLLTFTALLASLLGLLVATSMQRARAASTILVTSNADSGAGSLRAAIETANTTPGADTITFDPTVFAVPGQHTINLLTASAENINTALYISDDVTITGPGANVLTDHHQLQQSYRR